MAGNPTASTARPIQLPGSHTAHVDSAGEAPLEATLTRLAESNEADTHAQTYVTMMLHGLRTTIDVYLTVADDFWGDFLSVVAPLIPVVSTFVSLKQLPSPD